MTPVIASIAEHSTDCQGQDRLCSRRKRRERGRETSPGEEVVQKIQEDGLDHQVADQEMTDRFAQKCVRDFSVGLDQIASPDPCPVENAHQQLVAQQGDFVGQKQSNHKHPSI